MTGLISRVIGGSLGETADKLSAAVARFVTTDKDRAELRLEFERLLAARDADTEATLRTELAAQERVLVAELQQDDRFVKRARPSIIYFGLAVIAFNYCLVPLVAWLATRAPPELHLPAEFWYAWGGVAGLYAIGRSHEKRALARASGLDTTTGAPASAAATPLRLLGERK